MQTLEQLRHQLQSAKDLHSVVTTMKGLAAVNIRQYHSVVNTLDEDWKALEWGFHALLSRGDSNLAIRDYEPPGAPATVIAFGSDQGFCGQLNSRLARFLESEVLDGRTDRQATLIVVGRRLAAAIRSRGYDILDEYSVPHHPHTINQTCLSILESLQAQSIPLDGSTIAAAHHQAFEGASYQPRRVDLLPLDPKWLNQLRHSRWPTGQLPMCMGDAAALFAEHVRRYLLLTLIRALAHSLAAENAARLAAMQSAQKNIEARTDRLEQQVASQRQPAARRRG